MTATGNRLTMATPPEGQNDLWRDLLSGGGLIGLLAWVNERRKLKQSEKAAAQAALTEADKSYFADVEKRVDWALAEAQKLREEFTAKETFYQLQINELNSKLDAMRTEYHVKELHWVTVNKQQEIDHRDEKIEWMKKDTASQKIIERLQSDVEKLKARPENGGPDRRKS